MQKIFLNAMQKILPEDSIPLPWNRDINEKISLNFDVNDHITQRPSPYNFVRIKPMSNVNGFWH